MARPPLTATLLAAALALPLGAAAAPRRLSIGPVTGDRNAVIPSQLAERLCGTFECVLWPKVSTGGKADAAKLKRAGVTGVLVGAVKGGRASLVLSGSAGVLERWAFDLGKGRRLRPDALERIAADVGRRLAPPVPPPPPPPPPAAAQTPPPPPASPAQPPAKVRPPEPAPPAATAGAPAAAAPPRTAAPPAPSAAATRAAAPRPLRLALELGGFWSSRSLTYGGAGAGTGTLYEFDASAILGPRGRVELYPAAGFTKGVGAGVGIFVDAGRSLGLTTEVPGGGDARDSTYSRLTAGALWRIPVGARVALVPSVAYDSLKLRVDPAIAGLPDADLSGFAAKLAVELRVARAVKLLLGGGYVAWLTARDLIEGDVPYFPGDSAYALEAEGGIDVALVAPVSLRIVGQYSGTSYTLDPDPTGTYVAEDATDRFVSAHASIRAEF
jgi:hypothetical protein